MVRYRLLRIGASALRKLSLPFIGIGLIAGPILAGARALDARARDVRDKTLRPGTGPPDPIIPADGD